MDSTTLLSTENDACTFTSTFYSAAVLVSIFASIMVFSIIEIVLHLMVLSALVKKKEQFGLQSFIHISVSKCEKVGYCEKTFWYIFFHFLSISYSYILAYLVYICFEQEIYSNSILMFILVCPFILSLVSTLLGLCVQSCIKFNLPKIVPVKYKCYFRKIYLGSSSVHQNIYDFTFLVQYFLFSVVSLGWVFSLLYFGFGVLFVFFVGYIYDIFSKTTKQCIKPHAEKNPVAVWTEASMNSNSSVEIFIKRTHDFEVTSIFNACIIEIEYSETENKHLLHSTWNGKPHTKKSCGLWTNYGQYPTKVDHTL